ncbi:hypothetical protein B0H67DRAFT_558352 [Lasiosphaeris hirsuta]|uniref:HNH nuclease domain-containing protein n=1 Tax=Lasiosphaeris hirsuta TaxID=260670 RepID=A0AA40DGK8_9PEZI|nr:hypothetical protein B0H67DRAFT_558352 [Lasiosphaeris hirsuta]
MNGDGLYLPDLCDLFRRSDTCNWENVLQEGQPSDCSGVRLVTNQVSSTASRTASSTASSTTSSTASNTASSTGTQYPGSRGEMDTLAQGGSALPTRDNPSRNIPVTFEPLLGSGSLERTLRILHPGYPANCNGILSLPCVDPIAPSNKEHGLHHGTVLIAAQIVAKMPLAAIYRWIGAVNKKRLPIVPSFRDWQSPHDQLPESWPAVEPSAQTAQRCVLTNSTWAIERAHLVQQAQGDWFIKNDMQRYGRGTCPDINSDYNLIWLRSDLHKPTFDALCDLDVRRAPNTSYAIHVLVVDHLLFAAKYHDRRVPHLGGVAREYLFARFAEAIFIRVKPFILAYKTRSVARFITVDDEDVVQVEKLDGKTLLSAYGGGGKTRSGSPSKRKRTEDPSPAPGSLGEWFDAEESDTDAHQARGRKKFRPWEDPTSQGKQLESKLPELSGPPSLSSRGEVGLRLWGSLRGAPVFAGVSSQTSLSHSALAPNIVISIERTRIQIGKLLLPLKLPLEQCSSGHLRSANGVLDRVRHRGISPNSHRETAVLREIVLLRKVGTINSVSLICFEIDAATHG